MRVTRSSMRCGHYQLANKKRSPDAGGGSGLWMVPMGETGCGRGSPLLTDSALHAIRFNFSVSLAACVCNPTNSPRQEGGAEVLAALSERQPGRLRRNLSTVAFARNARWGQLIVGWCQVRDRGWRIEFILKD